MAATGGAADEGFDDCGSPRQAESLPPKAIEPMALAGYGPSWDGLGGGEGLESLVHALQASVSPQTCTQVAVALLLRVPADMLKLAMLELDRRLRRDFIGMLPSEISLRILQFLPATEVAGSAMLVSRKWYAVAAQPWLWRRLYRRQGWALDTWRWALYCSHRKIGDVSRLLLTRSIMQVTGAVTSDSAATLAPAIAIRSARSTGCGQGTSVGSDAQRLLDSIAPVSAMESLATATAEAMASRGAHAGAWQPRTPPPPTDLGHRTGPSSNYSLWTRTQTGRVADPAEQMAWDAARWIDRGQRHHPSPWDSGVGVLLGSTPKPLITRNIPLAPALGRNSSIDWRPAYADYHQLLANWRRGRCHVDRWEAAHPESIYCLQFDRRNRLFTGSRDHTVRLWHMAEVGGHITQLATLRGHTGSVLTLQADNASTLVTGSSDATVCVWDLQSCTILHRLQHADAVLSLRFTSKWLVTACKDRVLRIWRRDQGYEMFELTGHTIAVNAIHLHGDVLVSASGDRTIRVWDLTARTCVLTLNEHARGVACLDFDGEYIVSGSSDRSIRVWDAKTGACLRTIAGAHSDLVRTVMFNRRMDVVVSGSYDESIKIWSLSTGALLHAFRNVHSSRVFKLMFDCTRIVSCSHDRSVSIIDFGANIPNARLLV
ncbi:hypothetical protein H4R20_004570 [Coemansia guatemalensis]|uniref:F-box domain-containing protein n=1 Tax=Coemansia guatemalensis TaxID=2761395 RepID=A0A9W8HYE4_9FUNG|nr:hypothetical protein H4R20_004570 [Coemansia guatemalensis]